MGDQYIEIYDIHCCKYHIVMNIFVSNYLEMDAVSVLEMDYCACCIDSLSVVAIALEILHHQLQCIRSDLTLIALRQLQIPPHHSQRQVMHSVRSLLMMG